MEKLQELKQLDKDFLSLFLYYEFSKLDIDLTEEQLESFVKQIYTPDIKSISYEFSDEQLSHTKYSKEEDTLDDVLKIFQGFNNKLENWIGKTGEERGEYGTYLSEKFAKNRLEKIYNEIPEYFTRLQKDNDAVKQNIDDIWRDSLDLFELIINTTVEITTNFNVTKLSNYNDNIDLYDALQRLQGRACLITNEILSLLRAGFPDGAYARCRTLYETMVISSFISDNNNETAKRYLDYSIVNDLKEAKQFNRFCKVFGENKICNDEIEALETGVNQLKAQYGDEFANGDYNWALNIIKPKNKNIGFWEIEAIIDFKHMKPFYKSASNNIHTGASSLYFHRGLPSKDSDKILMGASSFGIETSCNLASYCINLTTLNLVLSTPETLEQLIQVQLLLKIREDLIETLFEVELEV